MGLKRLAWKRCAGSALALRDGRGGPGMRSTIGDQEKREMKGNDL